MAYRNNTHKKINPKQCCRFHATDEEKILFHSFINIFTLEKLCAYVLIPYNSICTAGYVHTSHEKFIRTFCSPYGTAHYEKFVHKQHMNHNIDHVLRCYVERSTSTTL